LLPLPLIADAVAGIGIGIDRYTTPVPNLALTLVILYALAILVLARIRPAKSGMDYLLAGRRLTLPAFVATLVTTWYGGILGVGEFAWRYGISTWVVFGLPYYAAALLFAFWLAPRLRSSGAASIPDLLLAAYGRNARLTGATAIFALTVPVAYLLMLATLLTQLTGWPPWLSVAVGATFSALYVGISGFRSVVRTDILQFGLMYLGFAALLIAATGHTGGLAGLWISLPAEHRSWDGGLGWQTVVVWYLIALQTMVEPSFYQRVFAARSPAVARTGVLVSVALWALFDFFSIGCGLAARALLPGLEDPLAAYPALAGMVLSPWMAAVFTLALFATVMSTLDSYLFLSAATVGHDIAIEKLTPEGERRRIRFGLLLSALLASIGALVFDSAITVWHHVGSVVTSSLLLPVVGVQLPPRWRYSPAAATTAMVGAALVAFGWILAADEAGYPFGIEPMFPALAVSVAVWVADQIAASTSRVM
jgi:SSS family solute:Na+ symporter